MRLVSCRIDGFGKYQNAKWDFSEGLNGYQLPNGEGKTTLAVFLRAMLYGMPTDKGDKYGVRSQYYPFQGGAYGGSLRVEWQGEVYEIARGFDKKSATKDTLTVLDGKKRATDALGEVPGLTLFGLTEEAFERTSYITWKQTDIGLGYGIGQRLGGLAADTSPLTLENALGALEEKRKEYQSDRRKYKGGPYSGFIPEVEEKIEEIRRDIYRAEEAEKSLSKARVEYDAASAEESALAVEIDKMQKADTLRARWENYTSLLSAAEEEEKTATTIAQQYPLGFPTKEEQSSLQENSQRLQKLRLQQGLGRQAQFGLRLQMQRKAPTRW